MRFSPRNPGYAAAIVCAALAHSQSPSSPTPSVSSKSETKSKTSPATQLPEVVVSGQQDPAFKVETLSSPKFTEPLLDTPQTVVAVPKEVFIQQGAVSLSDVLRNTPGITFAAGEGGSVASGDSFFMRGFDASNNIFVDGVRSSGAVTRDVYNLEQVEIAKGPAGADNGRGGSSGYINLVTKTPQLDPAYSGTMSYGTEDQKRTTADLNQPLRLGETGDWLRGTAVRLNGLWQDGGIPGRNLVENRSWAAAPSLSLGLGTPTRISLAGSYTRQDNLPDSGLPVAALPGALPTTPLTGPVNQRNYYGLANLDYEDVTSGNLTARIEHDINSDLTLRNQFVYTKTDRDALTTYFQNSAAASYNPTNGLAFPRRIHSETSNEIFSDQINATSHFNTGRFEHHLSGGLEFSRETQNLPTWTAVAGPGTSIYNPDPYRAVTADQVPFRTNNAYARGSIDTAAVYAFDTLKLNKYFLLNGSVRGEYYQTKSDGRSAAGVPAETIETSDTLLSWKGGVVFKPRENGSIYAAVANSLQPPGTTFTLSTNANNANNPLFDPQENRNYEVGAKWDFFQSRLSTSLALYRSENLNNVVQDNTTLEFVQEGKNTVQGVEVGISGKLTDSWFVFGGFGYADSEFEAPTNSSGGVNNGAALRFTPRISGSLWTAYRLPFGLTLGGGIQYSDAVLRSTTGIPGGATATALPSAQSYWILNAMATYEFNKNLSLRFNVNNLTDESYYRLNNNGGRYYPGIPRSYLLTANLSF